MTAFNSASCAFESSLPAETVFARRLSIERSSPSSASSASVGSCGSSSQRRKVSAAQARSRKRSSPSGVRLLISSRAARSSTGMTVTPKLLNVHYMVGWLLLPAATLALGGSACASGAQLQQRQAALVSYRHALPRHRTPRQLARLKRLQRAVAQCRLPPPPTPPGSGRAAAVALLPAGRDPRAGPLRLQLRRSRSDRRPPRLELRPPDLRHPHGRGLDHPQLPRAGDWGTGVRRPRRTRDRGARTELARRQLGHAHAAV